MGGVQVRHKRPGGRHTGRHGRQTLRQGRTVRRLHPRNGLERLAEQRLSQTRLFDRARFARVAVHWKPARLHCSTSRCRLLASTAGSSPEHRAHVDEHRRHERRQHRLLGDLRGGRGTQGRSGVQHTTQESGVTCHSADTVWQASSRAPRRGPATQALAAAAITWVEGGTQTDRHARSSRSPSHYTPHRPTAKSKPTHRHAGQGALRLQCTHAQLEVSALQLLQRAVGVLNQVGPPEQVDHRAVLHMGAEAGGGCGESGHAHLTLTQSGRQLGRACIQQCTSRGEHSSSNLQAGESSIHQPVAHPPSYKPGPGQVATLPQPLTFPLLLTITRRPPTWLVVRWQYCPNPLTFPSANNYHCH